jgi:hypothetical protein
MLISMVKNAPLKIYSKITGHFHEKSGKITRLPEITF